MEDLNSVDKSKRDVFTSAYFICGLLLLLINDFYLKEAFHNQLTGKLSDIAGLFIFPLFFSHVFGGKKVVYASTVVLFMIWKSELASPVINYLNALNVYRMERTVDMTDLYALLVIPLSYNFKGRLTFRDYISLKYLRIFIMLLTCFSFMATAGTHGNIGRYNIDASKADVYNALKLLAKDNPQNIVPDSFPGPAERVTVNGQSMELGDHILADSIDFKLYRPGDKKYPVIRYFFSGRNSDWQDNKCQLVLVGVVNKYGNSVFAKDLKSEDKSRAREDFELLVVDKLDKYLKEGKKDLLHHSTP